MPHAQRNPRMMFASSSFASNTNQITYTQEDFKMCLDPQNVNSWMEWQNCIELRTPGLCETRLDDVMLKWEWTIGSQSGMAPSIGNFSHLGNEARHQNIAGQFAAVNADVTNSIDVLAGLKPDLTKEAVNSMNRPEFVGMATVWSCGNPMGFVDTPNGRIGVNNLHSQGKIAIFF